MGMTNMAIRIIRCEIWIDFVDAGVFVGECVVYRLYRV